MHLIEHFELTLRQHEWPYMNMERSYEWHDNYISDILYVYYFNTLYILIFFNVTTFNFRVKCVQ